ncbi:Manganese ABC transporter, ATP-binding protein SitB [Clostridiaceae bacterium JG1575]|nr:Manganese ABC transporter, ATP-binding protein SitB [Clostridiaceae bacterium JG1575]
MQIAHSKAADQDQSAILIHDLTVAYDTKPVLWDVDLDIPKGELVAIAGPNGAGKSTLLKAMLGLLTPLSGDVHIQASRNRLGRYNIAYVPQSASVDWDFPATVLDVVLMGSYGRLGWLRRPGAKDREMALAKLEEVGMAEFAKRQISRLSGGQQQRVFLARALMQDGDIYVMDEPFKGVDARTEATIVRLLRNLKDQGKTVIVVHHDLRTLPDYFNWLILINFRVIAQGPMTETFKEENIERTYRFLMSDPVKEEEKEASSLE